MGCNTVLSPVYFQSGDAVEICRSDPETDDGLQGGTDARLGSGHRRPLRVTLIYILMFYLQGFYELIPLDLIKIFDENELEVRRSALETLFKLGTHTPKDNLVISPFRQS